MTQQKQIWKCNICGNIIEVLHAGADALDAATEKHVPVIEENIVKVGEVDHPMEDSHYIEWIEATSKTGEVAKVFLKPGDEPQAQFCFKPVSAREYCNLHGLWKK